MAVFGYDLSQNKDQMSKKEKEKGFCQFQALPGFSDIRILQSSED